MHVQASEEGLLLSIHNERLTASVSARRDRSCFSLPATTFRMNVNVSAMGMDLGNGTKDV